MPVLDLRLLPSISKLHGADRQMLGPVCPVSLSCQGGGLLYSFGAEFRITSHPSRFRQFSPWRPSFPWLPRLWSRVQASSAFPCPIEGI
jgi:hypothetical protein